MLLSGLCWDFLPDWRADVLNSILILTRNEKALLACNYGFTSDSSSTGHNTLLSNYLININICVPTYGYRWPDIYIGLSTMGKNMSVSAIQNAIDTAIVEFTSKVPAHPVPQHRTVTIELMVHPGYPSVPPIGGCGEGPDDFSQSWERLHELQTLIKPELQSHYKTRNIQLCSFKDL